MRVWRDIISSKSLKYAVDKYGEGDVKNHSNAVSTASAENRSAGNKARGVFDKTYASPGAFLGKIQRKVELYHDIRKDEYGNLEARAKALEEISALSAEFMKVFKVDANAAQQRNGMVQKDPTLKAHTSSNPRAETMDRLVLSLTRRSLRKAGYLRQLKSYYGKGGSGATYRDPKALMKYISSPQESNSTTVGLVPHVRLEALDPAHRSDFEADTAPGSCGYAFKLWAGTPNQTTPFFLWLENSMVCVADDKAEITAQSVPYERADLRETASDNKQRLVVFPGPLTAVNLTNFATSQCSTSGYMADPTKDPIGRTGMDMAAYVWTEEGELFIGEHAGHVFHHSSFTSGRKVRCAGMIKVAGGYVTFVSNNSGHYKPRKDKMRNFLEFLNGHGALAGNADVVVHTGAAKPWQGTLATFRAQFNQI